MKSLPIPLLLRSFALIATVLILAGCATRNSEYAPPPPAPPKTYAVVLFLPEGEEIADAQRADILVFARETLLASGLVQEQDRLIDDPERAELLFRARVQGGQITEIAGVPTFNSQHMVVLAEPRRFENRIWWDAYYPFGYPSFNDNYFYSGFPYPGPGWGYPTHYNDRPNRGRGRPPGGDYVNRDQRPDNPDGSRPNRRPDVGDTSGRPSRADRNRDTATPRPTRTPSFRGDQRNLEPADPRPRRSEPSVAPRYSTPSPHPASTSSNTSSSRSYSPPPAPSPAPSYSPPPATERASPSPRDDTPGPPSRRNID